MKNRQSSLGVQAVSLALVAGLGVSTFVQTAGVAAAQGVRYKVASGRSKFTIKASTSGLDAHTRTLTTGDVSGVVGFSKTMQPTAVQMTVKANSVKSTEGGGDGTRITNVTRSQILEAGKYPNIVFQSTKIVPNKPVKGQFSARVMGTLTMHGVKRAVVIPARGSVNGNTLRATGSFTLRQSDYGITLLSLFLGAVKVNDPVTLQFDIVANKA